jgi:hypothetical protein
MTIPYVVNEEEGEADAKIWNTVFFYTAICIIGNILWKKSFIVGFYVNKIMTYFWVQT